MDFGTKSLGDSVEKNVNTGRSVADEGQEETVQPGPETKQNESVEETLPLVRFLRYDSRIKRLFGDPSVRVEKLSAEKNLAGRGTEMAAGSMNMEPNTYPGKVPVTPH